MVVVDGLLVRAMEVRELMTNAQIARVLRNAGVLLLAGGEK